MVPQPEPDETAGLTTPMLLSAYARGLFPMASHRLDRNPEWVFPYRRGIIPLNRFHVPRSLEKVLRRGGFGITVNRAFARVIAACARPAPGRENTWISVGIEKAYTRLHHEGHAHSVECWMDGVLAGGLYGVQLRGAFFGESMFSDVANASKVALVHLVRRLVTGGFVLLDIQFVTDHLRMFGAIEITGADYLDRLDGALSIEGADFYCLPRSIQSRTHIS